LFEPQETSKNAYLEDNNISSSAQTYTTAMEVSANWCSKVIK